MRGHPEFTRTAETMLNLKPTFAAVGVALVLVGAPAGAMAQSGADTERFNRIENTMRTLTGQVEELTYQLRLLQEQLALMQQDTNFRLSALEGGATAVIPPAADFAPGADIGDPDNPPITSDNLQLGAEPQPLGTLTMDAPAPGEQPLDLSSLAGGDATAMGGAGALPLPVPGAEAPQVASVMQTGDPRYDYDQAYGMIRAGRYDLAEQSFRQFLATYPDSELAPEAQYWLGESFFARGDYSRAAEEFRAGYKSYPKSRRGPDTLLKLGLSMAGLGYRQEACQMYAATISQYPEMSNGLRQRVINEQASAGC